MAHGIFISKLCYLTELWGGCEGYLISALQVLQNRAARAVSRRSWFTPTRRLLAECKWLSVKQLVFYHGVTSTHKTITSGTPHYMHSVLSTTHPLNTRQAAGGDLRIGEQFNSKQGLVRDGFRYRAAENYNRVPGHIRASRTQTMGLNKHTNRLVLLKCQQQPIYFFLPIYLFISFLYCTIFSWDKSV